MASYINNYFGLSEEVWKEKGLFYYSWKTAPLHWTRKLVAWCGKINLLLFITLRRLHLCMYARKHLGYVYTAPSPSFHLHRGACCWYNPTLDPSIHQLSYILHTERKHRAHRPTGAAVYVHGFVQIQTTWKILELFLWICYK